MSYQKCPVCKANGIFKKESCPVCLGERVIDKSTGLPPTKYISPYISYPFTIPYYPIYPILPNPPIIKWQEGTGVSVNTTPSFTVGHTDVNNTCTQAKTPFTLTTN